MQVDYAIEILKIEVGRLKDNCNQHEYKALTDKSIQEMVSRDKKRIEQLSSIIDYLTHKPRTETKTLIHNVLDVVSVTMDISIDDIMSTSRKSDIVRARHFVMWICYRELKIPKIRISEYFDVDHTTVLHALGKLQTQIYLDKSLESLADFLVQKCEPFTRIPKKVA